MSGYEDALTRWLRDADKREQAADGRHKELVTLHRESFSIIEKTIEEGLRKIHDAILDTRR